MRAHKATVSLPLLATLLLASAAFGSAEPKGKSRPPVRQDFRRSSPPADQAQPISIAEIPFRRWREILLRTYREINKDRILAVAGGVAFYGLLAMFPTITAFVSLYALFADSATIQHHLALAAGLLPTDALQLVSDQVTRIAGKSDGTLGLASIGGLAIALWSANAGTKAIFDSLNIASDNTEERGFIALNLRSLGFTLGGILFLLLAVAAVVVVPLVLDVFGIGAFALQVLAFLRWPILFVVAAMGFSILYRFGPSRRQPKWHWFTPGSIVAAFLWIAGSGLFSWYLAHFADYNGTYGSLGAVIGLMMWMWLTAIVILAGAELDSEIEHEIHPPKTSPAIVAAQPSGKRKSHSGGRNHIASE